MITTADLKAMRDKGYTSDQIGSALTSLSTQKQNQTSAGLTAALPTTPTSIAPAAPRQTTAVAPTPTTMRTPVVNPAAAQTSTPTAPTQPSAGTYDTKTGVFSMPGATDAERAYAARDYYAQQGMNDKLTAANAWIDKKGYQQPTYTTMPEYKTAAAQQYTPVVQQLDSVVNGYTALIEEARGQSANIQAMIAAQLEGALNMLNQQEADFTSRMQTQMGADDPAIKAAINVLRESVAMERERLNEDLNARGLAQSGIVLEMNNRLSNAQLSQEEQLVASRVSELTTQLNQGLMQLMEARLGLHTQFGSMAVNAQMASDANISALGGQMLDAQGNAIVAQQNQLNWQQNYDQTVAQNAFEQQFAQGQAGESKRQFDLTFKNQTEQQKFENELALKQLALAGRSGGSGGGGTSGGIDSTGLYQQYYANLFRNRTFKDFDAAFAKIRGTMPLAVRAQIEQDAYYVYGLTEDAKGNPVATKTSDLFVPKAGGTFDPAVIAAKQRELEIQKARENQRNSITPKTTGNRSYNLPR